MKKLFYLLVLVFASALMTSAQTSKSVVFSFSAVNNADGTVKLLFEADIPDGYRLYSPYNPEGASLPLNIILDSSSDFKISGKIRELDKPTQHYQEDFGVTEKYFTKKARFQINIQPLKQTPFAVSGSIKGQTCDSENSCYMVRDNFEIKVLPVKKKVVADSALSQNINVANTDSVGVDTSVVPVQDSLSSTKVDVVKSEPVNDMSLGHIFLLAFMAGLAAIFTPCVFPMIPMTVSFFLKNKSSKGKKGALFYGFSIVALYTLPVAILIAISNIFGGDTFTASVFNAISTHWLPNILFFIIFLIFALSFLGLFEITMPSRFVNKMDKKTDKGGFLGIFFMAFVLVLVSFSCTGPIVGAVLVESVSGGFALQPVVAMAAFSIAFSIPFTLFAFFPELMKKLPSSGGWLNTVKVVLGFVELALGLKFLSVADQTYHWHLLDREIYLSIWISIGLVLVFYLLRLYRLPNDDNDDQPVSVQRVIAALITLSFTVYMIPGLWGAPLKTLAGYLPPLSSQDFVIEKSYYPPSEKLENSSDEKIIYSDFLSLPFGIKGYFEINQAVKSAKSQNKPLLLIFTGHGCVNCRKMEENVWSNFKVQNTMNNDFVVAALFVDDKAKAFDSDKNIGDVNSDLQFNLFKMNAQPYYVIVRPEDISKPLVDPGVYNTDVDEFLKFLKSGLSAYERN